MERGHTLRNSFHPLLLISHLTNSNRCGNIRTKVQLTVSPLRPSFCPQLPSAFTVHRFFNPLFSSSYKTILEQPLSFHIYTKRGVWVSSASLALRIPRVKRTNSFVHILLQTLCHRQKNQLLCNQANPNSFAKHPGWGYPESSVPSVPSLPSAAKGVANSTLPLTSVRRGFALHWRQISN